MISASRTSNTTKPKNTTEPKPFDATIGLGSNLGNSIEYLREAAGHIAADKRVRIVASAKFYESPPWGVENQPRFTNSALAITTSLPPEELLDLCQKIEDDMGRIRTAKWGPRVIDIDILTYRDLELKTPRLTLPHPYISERGFVLLPLKDIAPNIIIGGKTIDEMLAKVDTTGISRVALLKRK